MPAFASASPFSARSIRFAPLCPLRPAGANLFSRSATQSVTSCASAAGTQTTESATSEVEVRKDETSKWKNALVPGAVVEYWSNGTLCVGTVVDVNASTVRLLDAATTDGEPTTVSHGELISVWPEKADASATLKAASALLEDVDVGPAVRTLFAARCQAARIPFTSHEAAAVLFPEARDANIAAAAAARVIAVHPARFRRAAAGAGWRAYAPAVAATRETAAFVAAARAVLHALPATTNAPVWPVEQRALLASIEVCAASGAAPPRAVGRVLRDLGYAATDDAAAALLLDLGHWARTDDSGENTVRKNPADRKKRRVASRAPEWTFPPAVLDAAREIRDVARMRRAQLASSHVALPRKDMQSKTTAVFCVDDRNTNFLDDAIAVKMRHSGAVARVYVHVADVAGIVEADSKIDALARERGQSLYLPLRPLHMLPPPVMDAASFSSSLPTESVTVCIDFDVSTGTVVQWDVFPSLVPPVVRLNYEQLDDLLTSQEPSMPGLFSAEITHDLRLLAHLAPRLTSVMGQRRTQRSANGSGTEAAISGVRMVRGEGESRVVQVSTFREGGSHAVVADLLVAAGAVIREFARTRGVALPEDRGAASYTMRCGTAPMRRYADLVTQRQLRCTLFGTQPAGRRVMEELRVWLARRKDVAAKTVTGTRRLALFEALSDRCMRQARAAGRERAILKGRVRNVTVSKRGVVRVLVALHGTGLTADTRLSGDILRRVEKMQSRRRSKGLNGNASREGNGIGIATGNSAKNETAQKTVRDMLPAGTEVRVQIDKVDTVAQFVAGTVTSILT